MQNFYNLMEDYRYTNGILINKRKLFDNFRIYFDFEVIREVLKQPKNILLMPGEGFISDLTRFASD